MPWGLHLRPKIKWHPSAGVPMMSGTPRTMARRLRQHSAGSDQRPWAPATTTDEKKNVILLITIAFFYSKKVDMIQVDTYQTNFTTRHFKSISAFHRVGSKQQVWYVLTSVVPNSSGRRRFHRDCAPDDLNVRK
ncbi:hypothetical protein CEXT_174311 [Caerostris extrusa]|uniref:Uncharacterized protein n=1 Tax=Caerostris extrusa TaxID=172846 RepID=A0AAV4S9J4_CAEEX|nr:hypothetical protein CEXT_174311 [Caerostris extrusa]